MPFKPQGLKIKGKSLEGYCTFRLVGLFQTVLSPQLQTVTTTPLHCYHSLLTRLYLCQKL